MTNQEQAYINGFVKRASEYGFSAQEAIELLKSASPETVAMSPGAQPYTKAGTNPARYVAPAQPDGVPEVSLEALDSRNRAPVAPAVSPGRVPRPHLDEAKIQPGQRAFNQIR